MFYFVKTPWLVKKLYPQALWNMEDSKKNIYLTFDDGPHPDCTAFILEELKNYNAKATFFCLGKNVKEHFEIYKQIIADGHKPGNHTYNHLNGWKVSDRKYIEDVKKAAGLIDSNLFRPPYGRITKFKLQALEQNSFNLKTIMWDVLSGDFDEKISAENCYLNVINNSKPGSIIVFHDSIKAFSKLKYTLPRVLKYFSERGFEFKKIIL